MALLWRVVPRGPVSLRLVASWGAERAAMVWTYNRRAGVAIMRDQWTALPGRGGCAMRQVP